MTSSLEMNHGFVKIAYDIRLKRANDVRIRIEHDVFEIKAYNRAMTERFGSLESILF